MDGLVQDYGDSNGVTAVLRKSIDMYRYASISKYYKPSYPVYILSQLP